MTLSEEIIQSMNLPQNLQYELYELLGRMAVFCHKIGYSPLSEQDLMEMVLTHMKEVR
jgi:hypothetical protein